MWGIFVDVGVGTKKLYTEEKKGGAFSLMWVLAQRHYPETKEEEEEKVGHFRWCGFWHRDIIQKQKKKKQKKRWGIFVDVGFGTETLSRKKKEKKKKRWGISVDVVVAQKRHLEGEEQKKKKAGQFRWCWCTSRWYI